MNFIENVKNGVSAAVETISDAAQNLIEKNRINAQVNRLKLVIKNESSILNKAYIQLGKYYFENSDDPKPEETEDLFEIIANAKARLNAAQELYRSLIQQKTEEADENSPEAEDFEDTITVACSNEDEYEEPANEEPEETAEEVAEDAAEEVIEDIAEETASETFDEAADDDDEAF